MKVGLHALLVASGAAGLMYEVCWSRALGVWLGHGERGAAVTLTLFFLGLGLGYAVAARLSRTGIGSLRAYALCEVVIAVSAVLIAGLSRVQTLEPYLWLSPLIPTSAMGASFPFIMRALTDHELDDVRGYAFHLVGATLGTLVTTFVLIEALGVFATTLVAAGLSLGCASLSSLLSRSEAHLFTEGEPHTDLSLLFAAAVAGFCTLALEVLCLRLFALTFHNSTYTFGLTIAVFVLYLSLGSRRAGKALARPQGDARALVANAAALSSVFVLLTVPLFGAVTRFGELRAPSFVSYMLLALGLVAFVLALPVTAAGTLLPSLFRASKGPRGESVGYLSAANSLGAAFGAWSATFLLLPNLGLFAAFSCVALGYALISVTLAATLKRKASSAVLLSLLSWISVPELPLPPLGFELLARFQGPFGWVDLVEDSSDRSLSARLDLHYQLGKSTDRPRHVTMGTLPLSLHPQPTRALFVGLATGMTTSAALDFPSLRKIEVVELIREVTQLAERFRAFNRGVLEDPRLSLVIADGRSHIRDGRSLFDVIVCDLFVPSHSHTGYLYSVDHYRNVRKRLSQDGIFAQWLPLYMLGERELDWIGNSMLAVFPYTSLWLIENDPKRTLLGILGHMRKPSPTLSAPGARFIGAFRPSSRAELNTDERPRVEFQAPRTERDRQLFVGERLERYLKRRFKP